MVRNPPQGSSGGGGALEDSGSDNADGGDQYNLPQAEDSIDLQNQGDVENAASVGTDLATVSDTASDPSSNGEIRRNGTEIKAHSGSSIVNLSNIGSGSGDISSDDVNRIDVQSSEPSNPTTGDLWVDTS